MRILTDTGIRIVKSGAVNWVECVKTEFQKENETPLVRVGVDGDKWLTPIGNLPKDCHASHIEVCKAVYRLTSRGEDISIATILAEVGWLGGRLHKAKVFLRSGWVSATERGITQAQLAIASIRCGVYAELVNHVAVDKESELWREGYADTWLEVTGFKDVDTLSEIAEKIRQEYC